MCGASAIAALMLAATPAMASEDSTTASTGSGESVAAIDCTVDVTDTRISTMPFGALGVKSHPYRNPCGRWVRAYVHCNGFPAGTYYRYGDQTKTGDSQALCNPGDPRYGWSGHETYLQGQWHKVPTLNN
jgi:hypothetical protein